MLDITIAINDSIFGNIEIQNLRTSDSGLSSYRVDSKVDDEITTAFFAHCRGDGALVCISRAIEALLTKQDKVPLPLVQSHRMPDRI